MPAVLIKMLVASEPGTISLLPALPVKFPEGFIEGILCRGQVEIKKLSWSKTGIKVSLFSKQDQKIRLVLSSDIKRISIEDGDSLIEETGETGETHDRMISLPENQLITLYIDIPWYPGL
jgi:hypothetical protein